MPDAGSFVELANLRDAKFGHHSLDGMLVSVFDFANTVWDRPRLYGFVEHGMEHSYRVLDRALKMFAFICTDAGNLSALERFVLAAASLLHDIGMQYEKYPRPSETVVPGDIRKRHCQLGYDMVADVLSGAFTSVRRGPSLNMDEYYRLLVPYAAIVGFAHSGREFWDKLRDPMHDDRCEGGEALLRLRLLAALLRLADELHCEYTRVQEPNLIDSPLLTAEEKAHWIACYYVLNIDMSSPGTAGIRMKMRWRIPSAASDSDREIIRALLQVLRETKINQEWEFVKEYLKPNAGGEPCFVEFKMLPEPALQTIQPLPADVEHYVAQLRPHQFGHAEPATVIGIEELPPGPRLDRAKRLAQEFFLTGKGVISAHFRLRTGWHTDRYVRCRELCADLGFATELCHGLASFYSTRDITHVVSIGTSSIRIGSLLALLMGAQFSFVFASDKGGGVPSALAYTDYEMRLSTTDDASVLIIDDILGVGSVIHGLIERLRSHPRPPKHISVFTIYSLGDLKNLVADLPDVEIHYLAAFPDVQYRQQDEITRACEVCHGFPSMTRDEG